MMPFFKALLLRKNATWIIPSVFFIVFVAAVIAMVFKMNDGHFTYTLDDPYIHMALADNIAHGHYGVNANEYSAPASSIIWPFLLVIFKNLIPQIWTPLLLNGIFSILSIKLISTLWKTLFKNQEEARERQVEVLFGLIFVLTIGFIPLSFTGMEHILQIMTSLSIICGLIIELEESKMPWWLLPMIIISPLVRFENTALSFLSIIALWHRGYIRKAIFSGIFLVVLLAGFSLFLNSLGLGFVPTSVLMKSRTAWNSNKLDAVLKNLLANLNTRQGAALLLCSMFLLPSALKKSKEMPITLVVLGAIATHTFFGDLTSLRYTLYLSALLSIALLYVYRDAFYHSVRSVPVRRLLAIGGIGGLAFNAGAWTDIPLIPPAANNVYEQQYQMSRFAQKFYKKPIGVNDLGYVAFKNNNYVLDLWGLASKPVFELRLKERLGQPTADWMNNFSRDHNVKMAMIYDAWFPAIPKEWTKVAQLHLSRKNIYVALSTVDFYAIDKTELPGIMKKLHDFKTTLPPGVQLEIFD